MKKIISFLIGLLMLPLVLATDEVTNNVIIAFRNFSDVPVWIQWLIILVVAYIIYDIISDIMSKRRK